MSKISPDNTKLDKTKISFVGFTVQRIKSMAYHTWRCVPYMQRKNHSHLLSDTYMRYKFLIFSFSIRGDLYNRGRPRWVNNIFHIHVVFRNRRGKLSKLLMTISHPYHYIKYLSSNYTIADLISVGPIGIKFREADIKYFLTFSDRNMWLKPEISDEKTLTVLRNTNPSVCHLPFELSNNTQLLTYHANVNGVDLKVLLN